VGERERRERTPTWARASFLSDPSYLTPFPPPLLFFFRPLQVRAAVAAIAPDVLLLELCRDRVGLLIPPDRGPSVWHAPRVELVGVPAEGGGWPAADALLAACRSAPGVPVTTHDIEVDCVALQATGLFARVRFKTTMPPRSAGPQFLRRKQHQPAGTSSAAAASALQPAAPLGRIRFIATPRELAPLVSLAVRLDSALVGAGWSPAPGKAIGAACAAVVADAARRSAGGLPGATAGALVGGLPSLRALAVPPPGEATPTAVSVSSGALGGGGGVGVWRRGGAPAAAAAADPAVLKPFGAGAPETGLEASAEAGEGLGIEAFIPYRGPLPLTPTMRVDNLAAVLDVDLEPVDALVAAGTAQAPGAREPSPSRGAAFTGRWPPLAEARSKTKKEGGEEGADEGGDATADDDDDLPEGTPDGEEEGGDDGHEGGGPPTDPTALPEPSAFMGAAAQLLTSEYASRQSAAGAKVGVVEGAAWRAALEAADAAGGAGTVVVLGDVPARLTAVRLAGGVVGAAPLAAAAVVGAAVAAAWAATTGITPPGSEPALAAAVLATAAAAAWPFLGPLLEVGRLASKDAAAIEAAVAPPTSLSQQGTTPLRLWGEDAIIAWPGAARPVIQDRDVFMAGALWAAAAGVAAGPAFVADAVDDGCGAGPRTVWRYAGPPPPPVSPPTGSPAAAAAPSPASYWPARAAPARAGEGPYTPAPGPRAVVAIVGSAHVPGMQAAWARFQAEGGGVQAAVSAAAEVLDRA